LPREVLLKLAEKQKQKKKKKKKIGKAPPFRMKTEKRTINKKKGEYSMGKTGKKGKRVKQSRNSHLEGLIKKGPIRDVKSKQRKTRGKIWEKSNCRRGR